MGSVKEQLFYTLEELVDEELRTFQFFLYSNVVEGSQRIPKSRAFGLDRVATVELVVQTYGNKGAVTVTVDILKRMNFKQLAENLEEKCNEGKGSLRGSEKCNKKPFCECSHLWNFKRTSCKQD